MSQIDLDALEKLADEATPGEWTINAVRTIEGQQMVCGGVDHEYGLVADVTMDRDAAFIAAANPATIKALIAELKEAREHLTRCVELVPAPGAIEAADAFLARNGKGEG